MFVVFARGGGVAWREAPCARRALAQPPHPSLSLNPRLRHRPTHPPTDPTKYFLRYPEADILASSDALNPTNPPGDDGLEKPDAIHAAMNIGLLFFRHSDKLKTFMEAWVRKLDEDSEVSGLLCMNVCVCLCVGGGGRGKGMSVPPCQRIRALPPHPPNPPPPPPTPHPPHRRGTKTCSTGLPTTACCPSSSRAPTSGWCAPGRARLCVRGPACMAVRARLGVRAVAEAGSMRLGPACQPACLPVGKPPPARPRALRPPQVYGANGTLTFGVLPVASFASGHTFFVQRLFEFQKVRGG